MVLPYGRLGTSRYGCQFSSWSAEQGDIFSLSPFAPDHLVSRGRLGRPVPRLILHSQAEPCDYSRILLIPPAFRDGVHPYRQPPSGKSRTHRFTQFRTDDFRRQESAGTGPRAFKTGSVTGAGPPIQEISWANFHVPLFSHTHYSLGTVPKGSIYGHVEEYIECVVQIS